jgi:hypothetical protein
MALMLRRASVVYWCSALFAILPIALSQAKYGLLPMGGTIHILVMGFYPCVVFWIIGFYRNRRSQLR